MPVVRHVRSGDLGAKVQPLNELSKMRDDWLARRRRTTAGVPRKRAV
jgi:hypothetical protein